MPAPASPPADDGAVSARAETAIAAALAAIEGRPVDTSGRPARRAVAVIEAIRAHRPERAEA